MRLATTPERILASLIDGAILLPFSEFILSVFHVKTADQFILGISIYAIAWMSYYIILTWKCGGTLGKLIMGLRIRTVGEQPVKFHHAFMRSSVDLVFQIIPVVEFYLLLKRGQVGALPDVSFTQFRGALYDQKNIFTDTFFYVEMAWLASEFISMQFNAKRRALHDLIAGTLVMTENERSDGLKIGYWFAGIISVFGFVFYLMMANDSTDGKLRFYNEIWQTKNPDEIRQILTAKSINPAKVNALDQNILHIAAKSTDRVTFSAFVAAYPELINAPDFFGDTVGHLAARLYPLQVAVLISTGRVISKPNRFGEAGIR